MRFARIAFGLLLALVGLLVTLAGTVTAFWLVGPDNTLETGDQHLTSKGLAVMTAPDLLDRHGPTLHVTATSAAGKPVFVGVGQDIDVASYLSGSQYTRVVRLDLPAKFDTQEMKGGAAALAAPAGLDWWIAKSGGEGKQSIAWPIADGRYDVVVMNADGTPAVDTQVSFGVELDGAFMTCLLVLLAGLVLLVVGLLMMFLRKRKTPVPPVPVVPSPMPYNPPAYQGQGGVRRVAGGVGLVGAMLLVATGCVTIPVKNTAASGSVTRPAVTLADGQAVVKRYNELNNQANQARDAKLSETIEGDPTLAQTRAGYQIDRKLDAAGKNKVKPFTYTDPKIGAPEFAAYPMRFVVDSGVSDSPENRQLGVWQRQSAGTPWVLTNSVYPAKTMKVPSMDGLRVPTKADMAKLPTLPQAAGNDLATYLSGGSASPKAALFVPSPGTVKMLATRAKSKVDDAKETYISTVTDTFRLSGEPVTFIAANGEALVFLALTEQYLQKIEPGSNAYWTSGSATAFSSMVKYTQSLHQDYLHQVALVIPPTGKSRILSIDGQLVGAGGS